MERLALVLAVWLLAIGCNGSQDDGGSGYPRSLPSSNFSRVQIAAYKAVTEAHAEIGPGLNVARYDALIGNARRRIEDIQRDCKESLQSCKVFTATKLASDLNKVLMAHEAALAISKRILEVGEERQLAADPQIMSIRHTAEDALVYLGVDSDFTAPVEEGGALHSDFKLDLARMREILWSAASNKLAEAAKGG